MLNELQDKKITRKDLMKVFWRSFLIELSFNFERMQALGFAYTMAPIIKKLYSTKEQVAAALKRHVEFFNTTGQVSTFIFGITTAMEEQNSANKDFDPESINAVKAGLMGPVAGIGDSFFWGTFRVIAAGIGASLMVKGNLLGAVLFILMYNVPHFVIRYLALFSGYNMGMKVLESAQKGGILQRITEAASIVGLMVVGAMTATMVIFNTSLSLTFNESVVKVQDIFDQIIPSILPLGLTFFVYYLLRKKVKITYILVGLILFGILGKVAGLL